MSAHDCSPTLRACEDVLLMIFQHLDGQDLLRCEAVCRQWRQVMLTGTPWRRWLIQRSRCPELRPFWQKMKLDMSKLRLQDYRAICRDIVPPLLHYHLDYNWRHGKYEPSSLTFNVIDDVLTNGSYVYRSTGESRQVITLDKRWRVRAINRIEIQGNLLQFYQNIAVIVRDKRIQLVDCNDRHVISELSVECYSSIINCRFNGQLLAVRFDGDNLLRVWRVADDYKTITLISKPKIICEHLLEMDDKYIVASETFVPGRGIRFICTKTLEIEHTFFVGWEEIAYERGLLFIFAKQVIQTWNVAAGRSLQDLHIPHGYATYGEPAARIKANSKFLVVLFEDYFCCQHLLLCVYDLEALKTGNCSADRLLIHTMRVPYPVHVVSVDETHIVYCRHISGLVCDQYKITALNFRRG
jgi:F-box-like